MSTSIVFWPGSWCTKYKDKDPKLQQKVDELLEKMWRHLCTPQGFRDWLNCLLEHMGHKSLITLFAISISEGGIPTDVLGFVVVDTDVQNAAYVKYLCTAVENKGVGTRLLKEALTVVQNTTKHELAFVNYKPTETLQKFYAKCGFLPAGVREGKRHKSTENVLMTKLELDSLKAYCCAIHSELAVIKLSSPVKQLAPEQEAGQAEHGDASTEEHGDASTDAAQTLEYD